MTKTTTTEQAVIRCIAELCPHIDGIVAGHRLSEDLNFDSLDMVELGFELENALSIQFDETDIAGCATVGDVIELAKTKRGEA